MSGVLSRPTVRDRQGWPTICGGSWQANRQSPGPHPRQNDCSSGRADGRPWPACWRSAWRLRLGSSRSTALHIARLQRANETAESAPGAEAQASAAESKAQAKVANELLYASRLKHAFQWLEHGEIGHVGEILAPYESGGPLADFRGFEWYHLNDGCTANGYPLGPSRRGVCPGVRAGRTPAGHRGAEDGLIKFWIPSAGKSWRRLPLIRVASTCLFTRQTERFWRVRVAITRSNFGTPQRTHYSTRWRGIPTSSLAWLFHLAGPSIGLRRQRPYRADLGFGDAESGEDLGHAAAVCWFACLAS